MDELYELKEKLCDHLKSYGKKDVSAGNISTIDTLAHTIKNLDKIIETYEEDEYSNYDGNRSSRSYRDDRSYARRRDRMGRYSSGGYSRNGDIVEQLRGLMNDAPDDRTRQEIQKLVSKMEMM